MRTQLLRLLTVEVLLGGVALVGGCGSVSSLSMSGWEGAAGDAGDPSHSGAGSNARGGGGSAKSGDAGGHNSAFGGGGNGASGGGSRGLGASAAGGASAGANGGSTAAGSGGLGASGTTGDGGRGGDGGSAGVGGSAQMGGGAGLDGSVGEGGGTSLGGSAAPGDGGSPEVGGTSGLAGSVDAAAGGGAGESLPDASFTDVANDVLLPEAGVAPDGATCVIGAACVLGSGGNGVFDPFCSCTPCLGVNSSGDAQCQSPVAYGSGHLCMSVGGELQCVAAQCRVLTDCSGGLLCSNDNCVACTSSAGCAPYSATFGGSYVCASGACVSGTCLTSAECTEAKAGEICGSDHRCSHCDSDSECATDAYYAGAHMPLCDSGTHTCVGATCQVSRAACAGVHLCCGGECLSDTTFTSAAPTQSCCANADCAANHLNKICSGNVCSECPAVPLCDGGGVYDFYVDPSEAGDAGTTGIDQSLCRFKTLTYAFDYLAKNTKYRPARVHLLGDAGAATGEKFPLVVPAGVVVTGDGAMRTVRIASGTDGFMISGSQSGLSSLLIDNVIGKTRYNHGIVVQSGTAMSDVVIDHVTVQNAGSDAIVVGSSNPTLGGAVTLGPGLNVSNSGTSKSNANALLVQGVGVATLAGADSASNQTIIHDNTGYGVVVRDRGSIAVNVPLDLSSPTSRDWTSAPVVLNHNGASGLYLQQTPGAGAPTNTLSGLVTLNAQSGHGIRVEGGSKVILRSSVAYGNASNGVYLTPFSLGGLGASDFSGVDLGASGDAGHNVLQVPAVASGMQAPNGQNPNAGAGICVHFSSAPPGPVTIRAQGNWFASKVNAEVDCSQLPGGTIQRNTTCRSSPSGGGRLGIPTAVGVQNGGSSSVDVTRCVAQ